MGYRGVSGCKIGAVTAVNINRLPYSSYVDDIVLSGDDVQSIEHLKSQLKNLFDMKDLGKLNFVGKIYKFFILSLCK